MILTHHLFQRLRAQAIGEPTITRKWMENYSCDQVRYLARSFAIPGDHAGQSSTGVRMPFGGVGVITPFNFPLEIPALQTCSALFMGNQPLAKVDWKVAIVMEQVVNARFSPATPAPLTPSLTAYGSSATVHSDASPRRPAQDRPRLHLL